LGREKITLGAGLFLDTHTGRQLHGGFYRNSTRYILIACIPETPTSRRIMTYIEEFDNFNNMWNKGTELGDRMETDPKLFAYKE